MILGSRSPIPETWILYPSGGRETDVSIAKNTKVILAAVVCLISQ